MLNGADTFKHVLADGRIHRHHPQAFQKPGRIKFWKEDQIENSPGVGVAPLGVQ